MKSRYQCVIAAITSRHTMQARLFDALAPHLLLEGVWHLDPQNRCLDLAPMLQLAAVAQPSCLLMAGHQEKPLVLHQRMFTPYHTTLQSWTS
jgi:hypothetical protein